MPSPPLPSPDDFLRLVAYVRGLLDAGPEAPADPASASAAEALAGRGSDAGVALRLVHALPDPLRAADDGTAQRAFRLLVRTVAQIVHQEGSPPPRYHARELHRRARNAAGHALWRSGLGGGDRGSGRLCAEIVAAVLAGPPADPLPPTAARPPGEPG